MPAQKIAFLGATGDSAGFCLAAALNDGYDCIALARTPSKLTDSMKTKGVSESTISAHLTIISGDVRDVSSVKKTLQLKDGSLVDTIVSGIGAYPTPQLSLFRPFVSKDPTICQDACKTVFAALGELKAKASPGTKMPVYINFGTTGVPPKGKPRDVPLLFMPLYHYLLVSPHEDKRVLEELLVQQMQRPPAERAIAGFVIIRSSLLLDGDGKGVEAVRAGSDDEPAVGYTIARKDVGTWAFEKLLKQDAKPEWMNSGVSITY